MTTTYSTGTISVGAGSTTVTGVGTAWTTSGIRAGDRLEAAGLGVRIASVNSATQLTLARAWPGAGVSGVNYDIWLVFDDDRVLVAANTLLAKLTGGTLTSLGNLAGGANKLPYWTGAGVMAETALTAAARGLIDDADVAAMRTTLELVKTTSVTDATTGRMVAAGDFGIGTAISLGSGDNLDAITASGVYYNPSAANATGNNYPASSAGSLHVIYRQSNHITQTYITYGGAIASVAILKMYVRSRGADGWSPWAEVLMRDDILGTVSQSAGVPTGAAIERGSNANGDYLRLADGTQICWTTKAAASGAATTWTFPAAFSAAPVVTGTAQATVLSAVCLAGAPTTTAATYSARDKTDARRADTCHLVATGRWF